MNFKVFFDTRFIFPFAIFFYCFEYFPTFVNRKNRINLIPSNVKTDRKQILLFDHRFPNHRNSAQLSILELRFRSAIRQFFRESYLTGLQINRRAARRINFSPFERGFHVLFFARVYYPRADALRAGTKIGPSRYGAGNKPISLWSSLIWYPRTFQRVYPPPGHVNVHL